MEPLAFLRRPTAMAQNRKPAINDIFSLFDRRGKDNPGRSHARRKVDALA